MTEGIGNGDGNGREPLYRRRLEPAERQQVSLVLVEATKEVMDDATAVEHSLYDVVNPDALDRLFRPHSDGTPRASGSVGFPLGDYEVRIDTDGTIEIYGPEPTDDC